MKRWTLVLMMLLVVLAGCGSGATPTATLGRPTQSAQPTEAAQSTQEQPVPTVVDVVPTEPARPTAEPTTVVLPTIDGPTAEPTTEVVPTPFGAEPSGDTLLPAEALWVLLPNQVVPIGPPSGGLPINLANGGMLFRGNLGVSPDGSKVAYSDATLGSVTLVDAATGESQLIYQAEPNVIPSPPKFSPDGTQLAWNIGDLDGSEVVIYDITSGETSSVLQGTDNKFWIPVSWEATGMIVQQILWASDAGVLRAGLLDPVAGTLKDYELPQMATGLTASPDGDRVAVSIQTGPRDMTAPSSEALHLLDLQSGEMTEVLPQSQGYFANTAWSPGGSSLAFIRKFSYIAGGPSELSVITGFPAGGIETLDLTQIGAQVLDVAWLNVDTLVLLTNQDGVTTVWTLPSSAFTIDDLAQIGQIEQVGEVPNASIAYVPE